MEPNWKTTKHMWARFRMLRLASQAIFSVGDSCPGVLAASSLHIYTFHVRSALSDMQAARLHGSSTELQPDEARDMLGQHRQGHCTAVEVWSCRTPPPGAVRAGKLVGDPFAFSHAQALDLVVD